jgi:hypothetical protein
VVPDFRVSCRARGVEKSAIERLPRLGARALDPYRSADSVEIAAGVAIVFELAMKRQDLLEAPFAVPRRSPFVEVARRAAQRDMSVDGRTAAGNLAARVRDFASGRRLRDQAPVMRSGRDPGVQQIRGSLLDDRVVGARLEQQYSTIRILAEPRGQCRARRARSDNDIVVFHRLIPPVLSGGRV